MSHGCSPFPPWMPRTGTEPPGWDAPLPGLDLQNQLEQRQRLWDSGLTLHGEGIVPKEGSSKRPTEQ